MLVMQQRHTTLIPTQPLQTPGAGPSALPLVSLAPTTPVRQDSTTSPCGSPAPSRPPSRTERRYKCSAEGCDKAYFKPSRLAEHELTHTGERPHACPHCGQTYLRASHLAAHLRIHLPENAKTFSCSREGCGKTFWTATHLRRHEKMHDEAPVYSCEHCEARFNKAHLLRDHITLSHMPAGTKPYPCSHPGCDWSFALRHQLKAHEKTHDPTRYICSHPSHTEFPTFPTWSALQTHLHTAHPPTCPHEECRGRTFKSTQRLKEHLKVHEEREADVCARAEQAGRVLEGSVEGTRELGEDDRSKALADLVAESWSRKKRRRSSVAVMEGAKSPKLPRLADGEAGKEWSCPEDGCDKQFKTKFALETHTRTSHLRIKVHTCPKEGCGKSYAHLSNLQRHVESHSRPPTPISAPSTPRKSASKANGGRDSVSEVFTGKAMEFRRFGCPVHALEAFAAHSKHEGGNHGDAVGEDGEGIREERCGMRFWRVYDVRRHLRVEHGLELGDLGVRRLLVKAGVTCRSSE